MVSSQNKLRDEQVNIHYNYEQLQKSQNELVKVGDKKEVTRVKDLPKLLLDEHIMEGRNFPVQEDGHIKWISITESISQNSHRKRFGILLLGMEKVNEVNKIVEDNPDLACEMILHKWLDREGMRTEPITFRTLINVIYELGKYFGIDSYSKLANQMTHTVEHHQTMDADYIPRVAKAYSLELLEKYQGEHVIDSSQWIPKMLERNITFVDLEMKEDGNDMTLDDFLDDIQDGIRILFTGRPGVGKSTITRHISKHKHIEHFYLTIKFHLGELNDPINNLDTLLKIHVKSLHPSNIAYISSFIQRTSGRGVCFLLDGYDEYIPSRHGNYINGLVSRNELTESVVIVTSRPSAVKDIKFLFHREIEIIGFGERGINAYLKQIHLPDAQNSTIYLYLDNHPNIKQMCYLPLHLSMLVYIAIITDTSNLTLVDTETELYNNFLALTVKQYQTVRHDIAVESLKECFGDANAETDLCIILQWISKIAFDGLNNRAQVFTSSSLSGLSEIVNVNVSAEIEALSLFKIDTSYDRDGIRLFKYSYSHPTFQEFLAAFFLTTVPKETQLSYISYWWMHEVYKFFFGLIRRMSQYDDKTVMDMFIRFAKEDLATYQDQELYVMKCAHEAGNSSQYIPYLQAAGVVSQSNSVNVETFHSYNCWYLGYLLAQTHLHKLTVSKFSDVALCLSFIVKYLRHDVASSGAANVTKLAIGEQSYGYWAWLTDEEDFVDIAEISEFLSVFQESATHVELRYHKFEQSNSILQLGKILKSFNMLQSLALSVNVSIIKEGYLEKALQDLTHLRHLEVGIINKHDDDTVIPDDLLEFNNLNQLQSLTLDISWSKSMVDVNMTALLGGLKHLINLKTLNVRLLLYTGFRNNGANEMLLGIQKIRSIKILALHMDLCWDEGIGNVSVKELAKVLNGLGILLINLSLCIDFRFSGIQGHLGVIELANGLTNLTELQDLNLELRWETRVNDTIDEGAIILADSLKHLRKLHTLELNLQHNGSCNEIMTLFPSLSHLRNLNLKWTSPGGSVGQTDLKKLLYELKDLTQLQNLDLSWNTIGDDDVISLAEALKEMNHLHTLDLSHNEIGDDGIKVLAELFNCPKQYLCKLQVLILNFNKFSEVGAKILAEKLETLSQLHALEFDLKLGAYSAGVMSRKQLQNLVNVTIPSQQNFLSSIPEFVTATFQEHYYITFSLILGTVVLVGVSMCFRSKAGNVLLSDVSMALSHNSFSASTAWNLSRLDNLILDGVHLDGTGTVIVILDTAIDRFIGKNAPIPVVNCLPSIPITSKVRDNIHGTICSAVVVGSPPSYPRGVAPGARLIVYRIAEGENYYIEAILEALQDIQNKVDSGDMQVDVISISCDCGENNEQELCSKIEVLTKMGITIVAAAGNRGYYQPRASIPARFDSVISVGALDRNGKISSFTAQGKIDVYAPGEDIEFPYGKFWGTSYATPAVGGLVLLLKQCANHVGPPAKDNIQRVEILRKIFSKDMVVKSDSGIADIFDPVGFFMHMKSNPAKLNEIVQKYLDEESVADME